MKNLRNLNLGSVVLAIILFLTDFILKILIANRFEPGEMISTWNGWILIGRIENLRLPFGFNGGVGIVGYFVIAIQLAFVLLFFRIQFRETDRYFKYSSALIVFGWLGNYVDRLTFANGNWAYVHLDYFNLRLAGNSVINISSLMLLIGWIVFIVVALIKFNEFKSLFRKSGTLSVGN